MPQKPDVSLPIMFDDVIATSVPLVDPSQQDVSLDLPQHHPLPQRVGWLNPSFRWKMPRQFPHILSSSDKLHPPEPSTAIGISRYRRLLGLLQYLTITHPDISFALNCLSQNIYDPLLAH
ncbi:hypothetical protein V6N11_004545 [Hibiscus sabdariffa]|uniref:Uncharacterized protein n=1 Tax=Hibiscus sabdariffa TaxID=183260 RepID=A0ABR2SH81_9ROSI